MGDGSSSHMNQDFLLQDWMDVYVNGDAVVNDMHNVTLFRVPISLVIPLWSGMAFQVMRE